MPCHTNRRLSRRSTFVRATRWTMSSNSWRRRAGASRAATFTRALRARRAWTARFVIARAPGSDEIKSGNDCAPIPGTHDATTTSTTPSAQRHRAKAIDLHLEKLTGCGSAVQRARHSSSRCRTCEISHLQGGCWREVSELHQTHCNFVIVHCSAHARCADKKKRRRAIATRRRFSERPALRDVITCLTCPSSSELSVSLRQTSRPRSPRPCAALQCSPGRSP